MLFSLMIPTSSIKTIENHCVVEGPTLKNYETEELMIATSKNE